MATSITSIPLEAGHDDLIHDIAYDYYGKKLVTCSSDMKIKVWEMSGSADDKNRWTLNDAWKGHDASILKISWAHPEYGNVFATCSFDRTVRVWEEQEGEMKNGGRRWVERARLADSRGPIQCIEFAPHHAGLKLAACGADGMMRIYEAMDIVNLANWTLVEEFEVVPSLSGSSLVLREPEGHYCLSWCPSRFLPPMMAVGCGKENTAKIFRLDPHGKWQPFEVLPGHNDLVCDVAWAPHMGKSYHLIATASKDHHVRIFKLTEEKQHTLAHTPSQQQPGGLVGAPKFKGFQVELMADFVDHGAEVWKVEWNITGTVLSSSGDDGKVRLWKGSYLGEWSCIKVIS